jgi:hypothetical protein
MTVSGTTTPAIARKRARNATRGQKQASQPDGSLQLALTALKNAVYDLTHPRAELTAGQLRHLDSRYDELRDALTGGRSHGTHTAPSSVLPTWVDALKLAILIDERVHHIAQHLPRITEHDTPARLRHLTTCRYRPQDSKHLETIAVEVTSWSVAIDDLFAAKPKYLPDPCPHCQQTHAHRKSDDGETIRTPALALTVEKGAWCQACHDTFEIMFLARLLGYTPEGIIE